MVSCCMCLRMQGTGRYGFFWQWRNSSMSRQRSEYLWGHTSPCWTSGARSISKQPKSGRTFMMKPRNYSGDSPTHTSGSGQLISQCWKAAIPTSVWRMCWARTLMFPIRTTMSANSIVLCGDCVLLNFCTCMLFGPGRFYRWYLHHSVLHKNCLDHAGSTAGIIVALYSIKIAFGYTGACKLEIAVDVRGFRCRVPVRRMEADYTRAHISSARPPIIWRLEITMHFQGFLHLCCRTFHKFNLGRKTATKI